MINLCKLELVSRHTKVQTSALQTFADVFVKYLVHKLNKVLFKKFFVLMLNFIKNYNNVLILKVLKLYIFIPFNPKQNK